MTNKEVYAVLSAFTAATVWGYICHMAFRWPLGEWLDMTGFIIIIASLFFTSIDRDL